MKTSEQATARVLHFGGEEWEVTERTNASASEAPLARGVYLLGFHSAGGFVLHRHAQCSLNALNDKDLKDLLLLALLSAG